MGDLGFILPYKRFVSPSLSLPTYFSYLAYLPFPNLEAFHLSLETTYTLVPAKSSHSTFAFFLFFFLDVVSALGLRESIPIVLAAWAPAGISALLGLAMVFHLEDG